jgi:RNA polymerase sigma-70 factor (ECF subfamily)
MNPPTTSTEGVSSHLSSDLRRFIRRRVRDDHVADDLLQETFLRIQRGFGSLRNRKRLAGWVHQIARNVIRDHYRQGQGAGEMLAADVPEEADDVGPVRARGAEWMGELIRQLPDGYREAVQLSEIEGLTQQEVAARLGLSLSGAKARVQRGRKMLKEALEQCCVFHLDRRGRIMDLEPRKDRTPCLDCGDLGDQCSD